MKRAIAVSILTAGLAISASGVALAGKDNNRGSGGKNQSPAATLSSSCETNPCYAGYPVFFSGDGYDSAQGQALLQIGAGVWSAVAVDEEGRVDFQWNFFQIPGSYSVQLYQNGKGNKLELKAEAQVEISN